MIYRQPLRRCVVKADGLAAGKGVVVAQSEEAAFQAVDDIMVESKYGSSCGDTIIVEEMLEGNEVSVSHSMLSDESWYVVELVIVW